MKFNYKIIAVVFVIAFVIISLFFGKGLVSIASNSFEQGQAAYDRKDYANALKHFNLAASWINPSSDRAQGYIGQMYYFGLGVKQDYQTALEWLKRSARKGHPNSQYFVGYMYSQGHGVERDFPTAIDWHRRSGEQGHLKSQEALGVLYQAKGVTKSDYGAAMWFIKAAEQGSSFAAYKLGELYQHDIFLVQDNVKAYMWFDIAAKDDKFKENYKEEIKAKNIVAQNMSASDISKAQKMAQECIAKDYKGCISFKEANQARNDINISHLRAEQARADQKTLEEAVGFFLYGEKGWGVRKKVFEGCTVTKIVYDTLSGRPYSRRRIDFKKVDWDKSGRYKDSGSVQLFGLPKLYRLLELEGVYEAKPRYFNNSDVYYPRVELSRLQNASRDISRLCPFEGYPPKPRSKSRY